LQSTNKCWTKVVFVKIIPVIDGSPTTKINLISQQWWTGLD
jgi:hypothetical protein